MHIAHEKCILRTTERCREKIPVFKSGHFVIDPGSVLSSIALLSSSFCHRRGATGPSKWFVRRFCFEFQDTRSRTNSDGRPRCMTSPTLRTSYEKHDVTDSDSIQSPMMMSRKTTRSSHGPVLYVTETIVSPSINTSNNNINEHQQQQQHFVVYICLHLQNTTASIPLPLSRSLPSQKDKG
jgi:hypothetical protein